VLRGVEKAKAAGGDTRPTVSVSQVAPTVPVANASMALGGDSRRGQAQESWVERLHTQLSKEMDAAHKALVRSRKTKIA